jgi:hypothetical protein
MFCLIGWHRWLYSKDGLRRKCSRCPLVQEKREWVGWQNVWEQKGGGKDE